MKVFIGSIVHSTKDSPLACLEKQILGVDEDGIIVFVESGELENELKSKYGFQEEDILRLSDSQFLMPGMIDTHFHAPQFPNLGIGHDLPLLQWLDTYTFPEEARFSDLEYAEKVYRSVVRRTLDCGTTTAQYFSSLHTDSSLLLCNIADELGQRAFVGKVCMDRESPDFYCEQSAEFSLKETERFVSTVLERKFRLVEPVITPRFPISCSDDLHVGLAKLAKEKQLRIQSHISENKAEVNLIRELYPDVDSYTDVFRKFDLLNEKTVLAHGVYLSNSELETLKQLGASISHCPNSNISIFSGMFDLKNALEIGVKVCLGTDVSGGSGASMLDACRYCWNTSTAVALHHNRPMDTGRVSFQQVFKLATMGGADALGIADRVGSFTVGKELDALVIETAASGNKLIDFGNEFPLVRKVEKFLFCGDDRNIVRVYVCGKLVKST